MNLFSTDTQLFYYRFTSTIFFIAERTIPTTKPHSMLSVPWWNKACQVAINNKKHALKRMLKTGNPTDVLIFKRARAKAKKILNEKKKSCWQNYCSSISSNTKLGQVWSTVRRFSRQQNSSHFPSLQQNGITSTSDHIKQICWQISFRKSVAIKTFQTVLKETFNQFLLSYTKK